MKLRRKIYLLRDAYGFAFKVIEAHENGDRRQSESTIDGYRKVVNTIERSAKLLESESRFIIESEIIEGKRNDWYTQYLSVATYYRHAKKAYQEFINILDRI